MLKWTVHKRAEPTSALAPAQLSSRRSLGNLSRPTLRHRELRTGECRRKSLGSTELTRRIHNRDKENTHVLTPHPLTFRSNGTSTPQPFNKADFALRDVRNLTPKNSGSMTSLSAAITPSRKRPLAKTPPTSPFRVAEEKKPLPAVSTPTPYASTLPTFDVEYSPCGATTICLPKPAALSTIAITDTYFNQPRYFQEPLPASKRLKFSPSGATPLASRLPGLLPSKRKPQPSKAAEEPKPTNNNCSSHVNKNSSGASGKLPAHKAAASDESLSSSALNDTALDKMIDAILESARKERPSIRRGVAGRKAHLPVGVPVYTDSPTYTAAEDPASDLNKYCDKFVISPSRSPAAAERTIILEEKRVNEREVKTPEALDAKRPRTEGTDHVGSASSCHLRRQRAVRRKHHNKNGKRKKAAAKGDEPKSPSENSLSPKTPNDVDFVNSSFFKKSTDELANMNTPTTFLEGDAERQLRAEVTSNTSKTSYDCTPIIHTKDLQASSTPTNGATSIRRCLNFSENVDDDSMEKRKSTASSTVSMASTSTSSYTRIMNNVVSGSLDVSIFAENDELIIHGELV